MGQTLRFKQHLFLHVHAPRWKCRQLAGALPTHPCRVGRPHLGEKHLPSGPAVFSPSAILVAACIHLQAHPGFLFQGWLQWLSFLRKRQAKCLGLAQSSAFGEMAHYTPPSTLEQGGDGGRILCNTPQQVFRAKHPPISHTPTLKGAALDPAQRGWDAWLGSMVLAPGLMQGLGECHTHCSPGL